MQPSALRLPFRQLLAIVLVQILALTTHAWFSRALFTGGYAQADAYYVAYLTVPPILLLCLAPVLIEHRRFLQNLLSASKLTVRLAIAAIGLGFATRVAWWAQLLARVSFGMTGAGEPGTVTDPVFSFTCPPLPSLLLGLAVMALVVPLTEETVHRGLLQSAFVHMGPLPAVLISALVFTVFHPPSSYGFIFLMGLVLGAQLWLTGSLWTTIISHATYNALAQLDWRCQQSHWNPPADTLPLALPGAIALLALAAACLLILGLLRCQRAGAQTAPTPGC